MVETYVSYCGIRGRGKSKGKGLGEGLDGGSTEAVEEQVDLCELVRDHEQFVTTGVLALRGPFSVTVHPSHALSFFPPMVCSNFNFKFYLTL